MSFELLGDDGIVDINRGACVAVSPGVIVYPQDAFAVVFDKGSCNINVFGGYGVVCCNTLRNKMFLYAPFATYCGYIVASIGADDEAMVIFVGQLYMRVFSLGR